jgi:GNAT superfamily N-acetyltransferase
VVVTAQHPLLTAQFFSVPFSVHSHQKLPSRPRGLELDLADGTRVVLRPVRPNDAGRLRRGFEGLSLDTRTKRFLSPVTHLTDEQLRYFTDVDQVDHVAWGALDARRRRAPGLGIGRWIRLGHDPHVAEFSLTVVDKVQGRGLGGILLAVLYWSAAARDVRVLRGVVARTNEKMVEWLQRLGATPAASDDPDDGAVELDLAVTPDLSPPADTESARRLVEFARRVRDASGTMGDE